MIQEANIFNSKITPAISSGIFGVMYNYSNYYTILNIVAQCFRAIHIMSEKNQNGERKYQIRKGFELRRIKGEVTDSMTEKDQKTRVDAGRREAQGPEDVRCGGRQVSKRG